MNKLTEEIADLDVRLYKYKIGDELAKQITDKCRELAIITVREYFKSTHTSSTSVQVVEMDKRIENNLIKLINKVYSEVCT